MTKRVGVLMLAVILLAFTLSGCQNIQLGGLLKKSSPEQPDLIAVRIFFDRGERVDGYISELGVENSGKIYAGGSSLSHLYDAQGNVAGCFNYQKVTYILILPLNEETQPEVVGPLTENAAGSL